MDKNAKIAILGFGVEGRSIFEYLLAHGFVNLTVCDKNVDLEDKMPDGVSVQLGEKYLDDLDNFDIIFRSPGIRFYDPHIQKALALGVIVTSPTSFFMDQCPCPVIGVTGTNGKGTTCTLIFKMLEKANKDVYLGGNIGIPAMDILDKLEGNSLAVLELSSFQLQDLDKSPKYSVFLNTTSDHLDYHVDNDEYLSAKEGILVHQNEDSVAVLNKDYDYEKYYRPLVKGALYEVSQKGEVKNGAYVKNGEIFYAKDGHSTAIAKVEDVKLIGSHNLDNIMPALVIAKELGVSDADIAYVIETFTGLPNRLEFVREYEGVKFYNDSISTNAETSMAAVDSFDVPTVLIAGGSDKGFKYDQWALKILTKPSLKTVVLTGAMANKMEEAILEAEKKLGEAEGSPTKILKRKDFEQAVLDAYAEAEVGGVVLLSPAAASFDAFENYKARGQKFKDEVMRLR